jgi:hypothetical protein
MVNWSGWDEVKGDGRTTDAPAATVYDGKLYVIVRGDQDRIYYNYFDGNWSGWSEAGGDGQTPSAPAATVYNGKLYVIVHGDQNRIYYNQLTGTSG